jgi:tetratricopeptide (TPR) repeat protein
MTIQVEQVDTPTLGQHAVQLLSAIPYFDFETGTEIVALVETELEREAHLRWASDLMFELVASGALERVRDLHRVSGSVRESQAAQILNDDLPMAQRAINIFVERARGALRHSLSALMGIRAARVTIETLDAVAHPDEVKKFDTLVDTIHRSSRLGRYHDSASVAKLLQTYTDPDDRRVLFMNGLSCWQAGDHKAASRYFKDVLSVRARDHAEGVSAHLLGVHEYELGNSAQSLLLLKRAESTLRRIGDFRGLAITETSHGRILREIARPVSDEVLRKKSLKQFRSARRSLERAALAQAPDTRFSLGRIDLGQGQTLFDLNERDAGVKMVESSLEVFPTRSEENLWARIALAGMYRDSNRPFDAVEVLAESVKVATRNDRSDIPTAFALNVLASAERRTDNLDDALVHALASVEMGEELALTRHIGHALVTLALIEIDIVRAGGRADGPSLRRIRSHLYRSRAILGSVRDNLLLTTIDETLRSISAP